MKTTLLALCLLVPVLLTSCKSTGGEPCAGQQALVESVAAQHPGCLRLSIHCTPPNSSGPIACASTLAERRGKPSDPEDVKAMATGETMVLDQNGGLDVTVPICNMGGKFTGACGVTMKKADGMTRDQLVAEAKTIAKAVEAGIGECATNCCAGACAEGGTEGGTGDCCAPGSGK